MKKLLKIIFFLFVLAGFTGLIIYAMGLLDYIPQLRASAVSPDGALTVKVYERRLSPRPLFARMGASAKVYDNRGNLVYDNLIYHDDDWDDTVGQAFNQISFEGDEIHIGPGVYDRNKDWIIKRSDLKTQADQ